MVRSFHYLQLLSGASLVSAQASTYVAAPKSAYSVTLQDRPTPAADEVVVQTDANGDVNLFPGENRKAAIKKAREGCGGKFDENCYNSMAHAWGFGADSDNTGISKRFPPLLIAAFVVGGISIFISMVYEYTEDMRLPKDEVSKATQSAEATNVYQAPDNSATITVPATPAPTPTGDAAPSVVQLEDGSVEITIPADDIEQLKAAVNHIICKRSMRILSRQENSDALRDCIDLAAQDIAKNTDIGGWLQKFQGLRWEVRVPNAPNEIPIPGWFDGLSQALQDVTDLLSVFGEGAAQARDAIARFSLLVAWAQQGAGVEIDGKMKIPADKLKEKGNGDDNTTCKAPMAGGNYFCNEECGGKDPTISGKPAFQDPQSTTADDYNQVWKCKGREDNDDRKGCDCIIPHPAEAHSYKGIDKGIGNSQKIFTGSKFDSGPAKPKKICYKADADRMKDHKNWKFMQQTVLDDDIKAFCGNDWDTNAKGARRKEYHGKDDWNYLVLTVDEKGKQENCEKSLMDISAGCDFDPEPDVNKNINQFNWKWGGEFIDDRGAKWTIEPQRERVAFEKPADGSHGLVTDSRYCEQLDDFAKHDNKGNNGKTFDDVAKMTLQMCVHQFRIFGKDTDDNCGGLLKLGLHAKSYNDPVQCADNTWQCVSFFVENNTSGRGHHRPGFSDCWGDLYF